MKRLFCKVPDLQETFDIIKELEELGVKQSELHVYSNTPEIMQKEHIHPLTAFQMANVTMLIGRALVLGVFFTIIIYTLFLVQLPSSTHIPVIGHIGMVGFGVGFGFWVSGMIGLQAVREFNVKYASYVQQGHYLMMIDALDKREKELMELIMAHHANVEFSDEALH